MTGAMHLNQLRKTEIEKAWAGQELAAHDHLWCAGHGGVTELNVDGPAPVCAICQSPAVHYYRAPRPALPAPVASHSRFVGPTRAKSLFAQMREKIGL